MKMPQAHAAVPVWLSSAYIIAAPFYFFESGMPQPADVVMVVLLAFGIIGMLARLPNYQALFMSGAVFLLVVTAVNVTWWSIYYDRTFILSTLYYYYNFFVLVIIVTLVEKYGESMIGFTKWALLISIGVEVGIMIAGIGGYEYYRAMGTFNNPNQLAYWSLLTLGCWAVLRSGTSVRLLDLAFMLIVSYLVAASVSRAGLSSVIVIIALIFVIRRTHADLKLGVAMMVIAILGAEIVTPGGIQGVTDTVAVQGLSEKMLDRAEEAGDDSATARGYDRMWRFPEYLFFGAGEGALYRFGNSFGNKELHSTWANLLFSYGILGFVSFLAILVTIFKDARREHLAYFLPIAMFGLTHQGQRFTLFWVYLGLAYGIARRRAITHRHIESRPSRDDDEA